MKNYLVLCALFFCCCTNDQSIKEEESNSLNSSILSFTSKTELQNKIDEINFLKEQLESNLLTQINIRNNSEKSIFNGKINEPITFNNLKKDLEFYHGKRLEMIYELRSKLGFTSLQSIVDEINSLVLFDPQKAEQIFNQNSGLLKKTKFSVVSKFGEDISTVLNTEGKIKIGEELIDFGNKTGNISKVVYEKEDKWGGYESTPMLLTNDSKAFGFNWGVFFVEWRVGKKKRL